MEYKKIKELIEDALSKKQFKNLDHGKDTQKSQSDW